METSSEPSRTWVRAGAGVFFLLILGIAGFALRHLQKQSEVIRTIETKNAQVIAAEAPELALSPEDREVLERTLPVEPTASLTPSEKETLDRRVPLRSRLIQGLATPPWDEKQFQAFLKTEET